MPVSRSGGCHFLLTYRSASCAQYTEHIRIKNIVVVLHIVTKQSSTFELYAGKGGQAMSLTKLVSQGAVDNCTYEWGEVHRRGSLGQELLELCHQIRRIFEQHLDLRIDLRLLAPEQCQAYTIDTSETRPLTS